MVEDLHDRLSCTWSETLAASGEYAAERAFCTAVDVLFGRDELHRGRLVEAFRERQLHENAVNSIVFVQLVYKRKKLCLCRRFRQNLASVEHSSFGKSLSFSCYIRNRSLNFTMEFRLLIITLFYYSLFASAFSSDFFSVSSPFLEKNIFPSFISRTIVSPSSYLPVKISSARVSSTLR